MKETLQKIYDYTLEDIMGESFGRYSKYIIQDRAIPDVRDGLKPVQRRILYAMYKQKWTHDRPYNKSAYAVGEVMGKYHPHGDSSIYEAMVRMSQTWKIRNTLIDMQGNNGSIDGDSPAAQRYTEARLAKISNELLRDIDKNTIIMTPNYDDKLLEPTVLPAKFPNLLVNGATGISAGYATNIPPHNLEEIIDATISIIKNENITLEELMEIIKGPDFPTGGIVEGLDGIKDAYQTGRGKIVVKSKVSIETHKGKDQLIVTEIPYEVNKAILVKKIDDIRINKKIDGIVDVRDESDKEGLRIAIDLKKDIDPNLILSYLYKNTELQISYNFNMVSIVNRRPKLLGIKEMLEAYIVHQKEVITKRTIFDLEHAKARFHIVEGLIKALSILDEIIATIRASKNKSDAEHNLVIKYDFTEIQAEAIVTLQLYRLTNTDVTELETELKNLTIIINGLNKILENKNILLKVIIDELTKIKEEYKTPRLSEIKNEVTEIKIDTISLINKEDVVVVITKDGYIKRVSNRSYNASEGDTLLKEGDYILGIYEVNTLDVILLFTDLGNYLYIPVYEIPDMKWKEIGKHISNIITISDDENIISSLPVYDFNDNTYLTFFTKAGMTKRVNLSEFKVLRYSKALTSIKLSKEDRLISVIYPSLKEVLIITNNGYALRYNTLEIPLVGTKASGVKAINLNNDYVVSAHLFDENNQYLTVITDKGTGKRIHLRDISILSRARKGIQIIREVKTNPHYIIKTFISESKKEYGLIIGKEIKIFKNNDLTIMDRYSTGSSIIKGKVEDVFEVASIIKKEINNEIIKEIPNEEPNKQLSLIDIDNEINNINTILKNTKDNL